MYELFTARARRAMHQATLEAEQFNDHYIRTEHILVGLVKEGGGIAAHVLKEFGVDLHKIRMEVEKFGHDKRDAVVRSKLPQTLRAKKVIEYAIEEARSLNHNYVGTEHILLGLLREQEGVAVQVLMNLGLKLKDVREEVLRLLGTEEDTPTDNWSTGKIATVFFKHELCTEDEMLLHIIVPSDSIRGGDIQWRMVESTGNPGQLPLTPNER